ncbi:hypothetical protein LZD49_03445 [Dyadobacter sp. CY261]|uniref:hypothetical protein n=1 Tax=Dyadobacter sp. CY261 TaxID=2907203 RepID=UPI001F348972|nr:hypothetical protein [Dyadobacter sp. CY261]MCF0069510.1 hypothetical protein [Dyadobacter sp. CY261]
MFSSIECPAQQAAQAEPYLALLRKVLHEQEEWVKVHAAEYLIWAGHAEGVKAEFLNEEEHHGNKPQYRVGIWRVLAQLAENESEKLVWLNKMKAAFLDPNGPDRIHAAETLAKLRISPLAEAPDVTSEALKSDVPALALYTLWATAFDSPNQLEKVKMELIKNLTPLSDSEAPIKSISAYALRQLGGLNNRQWQQLAAAALHEQESLSAKVFMLSAAWLTAADSSDIKLVPIKSGLLKYHSAKTKGERSEMAMALAGKGGTEDLQVLTDLFENKQPLADAAADYDVMAAAAFAILEINKRAN